MTEKPLLEQLSEGLKNAVGMTSEPAKGKVIPVLKKLPTIKKPLTDAEKRQAYQKRKKRQALNMRLKKLEANQSRFTSLEKKLQTGVRTVNAKAKEHAALKRTVMANKKAIDQLRKDLALQKRYAAMLMKKWEKKNAAQLQKMSAQFSSNLKQQQSKAFNAYAQKKVQDKKKAQQKSVKSTSSFPGKRSSMVSKQVKPVTKKAVFAQRRVVKTTAKAPVRAVARPAVRPVARTISAAPRIAVQQRPGTPVRRPAPLRPVTRPAARPVVRAISPAQRPQPRASVQVRPAVKPVARPAVRPVSRVVSALPQKVVQPIPTASKPVVRVVKPAKKKSTGKKVASAFMKVNPSLRLAKGVGKGLKKLFGRKKRKK